jgi:hypothetical protein
LGEAKTSGRLECGTWKRINGIYYGLESRSSGRWCRISLLLEYVKGEAVAQSTTYAYTRGNSPTGLLDMPAVGLQKLSKISERERVKDTEARRKLRPKPDNHPKPRPKLHSAVGPVRNPVL